MKKNYVWVLVTYVVCQLGSGIVVGLLASLLYRLGVIQSVSENQLVTVALLLGCSVSVVITLKLLRSDIQDYRTGDNRMITGKDIGIAAITAVILLMMQIITAGIENQLGVKVENESMDLITELVTEYPINFILPLLYAPFMEEIIFRKILIDGLRGKIGIVLAVVVSSLLFGLAHFEPTHLLVYTTMGLILSIVYVKTGRIVVTMLAHFFMNMFVLLQLFLLAF